MVVKGFLRAHRAMRFRARKSPSCLGLGWYDLFMMNCLVPSRANWALGQLPHKVTNALTGKLGGLKAGDSFACEERIYQRPLCHFAGSKPAFCAHKAYGYAAKRVSHPPQSHQHRSHRVTQGESSSTATESLPRRPLTTR